ncbi:MAG TPA: CHAD domain-containing protein [Burkholderiales bacterium]|nr:CHAD domain-containing protein [Burkholderiales bacterium]
MNPATREVELKLSFLPEHYSRLQQHPLLKTFGCAPAVEQKLLSHYYDTPELSLWNKGLTLRLRSSGSKWIQTVKSNGAASGGLHERTEWESPVNRPEIDWDRLREQGLDEIGRTQKLRQKLKPVFTTEITRIVHPLQLTAGEKLEFCLDRGKIKAGDAVEMLSEIELELKSGSAAALYDFAAELQKTVPLRLENASKAERGYLLYAHKAPPVVKATALDISPDISVNEAFKRTLWNCIHHLQGNESGMLLGVDPEYLHQMRVALRRMHAALGVFKKALAKDTMAPIEKELKTLRSALGPARDWDVFVTEFFPSLENALPESRQWVQMRRTAALRRAARNRVARNAVASEHYGSFMLMLCGWLSGERWHEHPDQMRLQQLVQPLSYFAPVVFDRYHRKLKKRGKNLEQLSSVERHALRIAVKKQRYACEFFSGLYPRKRTKRYLRALSALQDCLGTLNDLNIQERLLSEMVERNTGLRDPVNRAQGWIAATRAQQLAQLNTRWEEFKEQQVFWK